MACRGVLFAIDDITVAALLAADSDRAVRDIVERIEDAWDEEFVAETDKAWDAMHRALSNGTLDPLAGEFPLNRAILGGQHLHQEDDYIVALVPKADVPAISRALAAIDDEAMAARYDRLVPPDYAPDHGADDREYTVAYFRDVAELYERAARAGRAVVFTVDQ